jgi:hypothetical protein
MAFLLSANDGSAASFDYLRLKPENEHPQDGSAARSNRSAEGGGKRVIDYDRVNVGTKIIVPQV